MKTLEELTELFKEENEEEVFEFLDEYDSFDDFEADLDYETKHSFWYFMNNRFIQDFYSYKEDEINVLFSPNDD